VMLPAFDGDPSTFLDLMGRKFLLGNSMSQDKLLVNEGCTRSQSRRAWVSTVL